MGSAFREADQVAVPASRKKVRRVPPGSEAGGESAVLPRRADPVGYHRDSGLRDAQRPYEGPCHGPRLAPEPHPQRQVLTDSLSPAQAKGGDSTLRSERSNTGTVVSPSSVVDSRWSCQR
jgi:hypothetical protein